MFRTALIQNFALALLTVSHLPVLAQTIITLDPAARHQTISGWECVTFASQDSPAFPNYRDELLHRAVNEAGITRVRLEVRSGAENSTDYWTEYQQRGDDYYSVWRANRYATVNDNADPNVINPAGFHFSQLSSDIERIVLPLREVMAANGESLYVNLNYVAFTSQIIQGGAYHHNNPDEYAEFILAAFQHIDQRYGFVPDAVEILLEPDNVSQWNGNLVGRALVATANRLQAAGYTPDFIAPSCTSMANAISYFDALAQVSGAVDRLTEICYHRYGGVSDSNLRAIATRARQRGLNTSMLEWWSNSNGHDVLHTDLKTGNNSAWQHGVFAGIGALNNSMTLYMVNVSNSSSPTLALNRKGRLTRQYYRFVRPGAVRIEAQTSGAIFDPLALINPAGERVVVVKAASSGNFTVRGLPPAAYALSYSTPSAYDVKLPDQTIPEDGEISATMPRDGVLTIYTRQVRILNPRLSANQFSFSIYTLAPNAALQIQRSSDPSDPNSWTPAGAVTMDTLKTDWSETLEPVQPTLFYRVVFQ